MSSVENVTIAPNSPLQPTLEIRLFGAISYFCLATLSLLANLVLAYSLHKYTPPFPSAMAFLLISWQLCLSDILSQCIQLILAVPLTFTGQPLFGHSFLLHFIAFFDTLTYNSTLCFSVLMTLNRIAVFFWPKLRNFMFQMPNIYFSIAALWLYDFCFCLALNLLGCQKEFAENGFYYFHKCISPMPFIRVIYSSLTSILPPLMLIAYLTIFVHMKISNKWRASRQRRQIHTESILNVADLVRHEERAKMEKSVLIQSFLICGTLELQNICFNLLTGLISLQGQWSFVVNILGNWISIANNSMTAIALFTFNSQIRQIGWAALWRRRKRRNGIGGGGGASSELNPTTAGIGVLKRQSILSISNNPQWMTNAQQNHRRH